MVIGAVMATDADNLPPIIYNISADTPFDIDSNNGNIFRKSGASLDFEDM